MHDTNATSVSGYAADSDWLAEKAPAVALELLFLGHPSEVNLACRTPALEERLEVIGDDLNRRFRDCEFRMLFR